MTPHRRRVVQAVLYEGIAVLFITPTLALLYDQGAGATLLLSVLIVLTQGSAVAPFIYALF